MRSRVVAVVLAAGASSRFGSPKLLAELDGRPVLAHVLDALQAAGIGDVFVVARPSDWAHAVLEGRRGVVRVENPRPERGLSSSVRLGIAAARARTEPDAILVALGDQPRLSPDVIGSLLAADGALVVPRYADGSNPNPVLLRPSAYPLVEETTGDRGLGPVLARHREIVVEVPVAATNPDVDTPADLARLVDRADDVP